MIYPTLYNGPVQYFARLIKEEEIILEQYDSYVKQTYRNRCKILGTNGPLLLSIPVKRIKGTKNQFKDVRIDYDMPWNKIHWKSLVSAYAASPFFEFIMDDLVYFYENRFEFLVDLNSRLLERTLEILGLKVPVSLTEQFEPITGDEDPRYYINPKLDIKVADTPFRPLAYHQVFEEKHGFKPNLSILDLVFNEGPGSLSVLSGSLKT